MPKDESFEEVLNSLASDNTENENDQLEEVEIEADKNEELDDSLEDDSDSLEDDDEEDSEIPVLEGEFDSEARALWERQWKGIKKRETQLAEKQKTVEKYLGQEQRIDALTALEEAILDASQVKTVFANLATQLAKHHNLDVADIVGIATTAKVEDDSDDELFDEDKRLLDIAEKRLMKKFGPQFAKLAELEQAENQRKSSSSFENYIDETQRTARLKVKKELGVEFTKQQFVEAIKAYPELKANPEKALKVHFADVISKELTKRVTRARGPELTRQSERVSKTFKKPKDISFLDLLDDDR